MITLIYKNKQTNVYTAYVRHGINGQFIQISEWEAKKEMMQGKWTTSETELQIKYKKEAVQVFVNN